MSKGLGIAALVIAILAFFIPFIGPWITIFAGALAIGAWSGSGFGLGIATIIVNFFNIFMSPSVWISAAASALASANTGHHIASIGGILMTIQIIEAIALVALHFGLRKRLAKSVDGAHAGVVGQVGLQCSNCRTPFAPDDRFCGTCGSRLAA